jgi:hypothetical protein
MNYKNEVLNRLEAKSEQLVMVTMHIQGAIIDNDVKEMKKWISIGDDLQAEMEVLMLIHEVYNTRVN